MLCPYCGKEVEDGAFCDCPGVQEELAQEAMAQINQEERVDISPETRDASETVNAFLNNAKGLLGSGAKKAKEAAAIGAQKAQKAVQDGAEKIREQQRSANAKKSAAQPQRSMLIDPNETVIASLGNSSWWWFYF